MPIIEIPTPHGPQKFAKEGDFMVPVQFEKKLGSGSLATQIEWTRNTEVFPDDVIVCAYPKAGRNIVLFTVHQYFMFFFIVSIFSSDLLRVKSIT